MDKRDLKADYRELWSRLNESWEDWNDFKIAHGEQWLERAIAEKERADKTHQIAMSLIQQLGGVLELVKDGVFVEKFDVDGPALCIPLILMVAFQELRRAKEALGDG